MHLGIRAKLLLVFCGLVGLCSGLGGYTFYYARGASYFSDDPVACVNCHVMRDQYDGWQKSSHHSVATCNSCHVPHELVPKYLTKLENGFWHAKGFTLMDFPEPIRIRPQSKDVVQQNCLLCHQTTVSEMTAHVESDDIDCVMCHRDVGHGPAQ